MYLAALFIRLQKYDFLKEFYGLNFLKREENIDLLRNNPFQPSVTRMNPGMLNKIIGKGHS